MSSFDLRLNVVNFGRMNVSEQGIKRQRRHASLCLDKASFFRHQVRDPTFQELKRLDPIFPHQKRDPTHKNERSYYLNVKKDALGQYSPAVRRAILTG